MISPLRLRQRASLLRALRAFFHECHYLEIETPNRIPQPLPETHIDHIAAQGWYLHSSPEQCMKRLLAHGEEALFQICKVFRQGERGKRHLPEFTMLEWYRVGWGYRDLMNQCEELFSFLDRHLGLGGAITRAGKKISLATPWERLTVAQSFARYGSLSLATALVDNRYEEILVTEIEPHLGMTAPTFLYDYPLEHGSLARRRVDDPAVAERFELYIGGIELANGFSELSDPQEQRRRFQEEIARMGDWGKRKMAMPEAFLRDLVGMPEAAGIALGVDRLAMIVFGAESIDEIVSFVPEELA